MRHIDAHSRATNLTARLFSLRMGTLSTQARAFASFLVLAAAACASDGSQAPDLDSTGELAGGSSADLLAPADSLAPADLLGAADFANPNAPDFASSADLLSPAPDGSTVVNGNGWSLALPSPRGQHAAAWDTARQRLVVMGGV